MTKIRIKTFNEIGYPNNHHWNSEMTNMCGKVFEATQINYLGPFCFFTVQRAGDYYAFLRKSIEVLGDN